MTLLDVKNLLITFFIENDSFSVQSNLDDITPESGNEDSLFETLKEGYVRTALKELEKDGIILPVDITTGTYILIKPIGQYSQKVEIGPYTAELIGQIVNSVVRVTNDTDEACDKLAICERDIRNVIQLCHTFMANEVNKK